jgi:hypothetical protein
MVIFNSFLLNYQRVNVPNHLQTTNQILGESTPPTPSPTYARPKASPSELTRHPVARSVTVTYEPRVSAGLKKVGMES